MAGTNGKGTTSSCLWQLYSMAGTSCGLYTSPHLISFTERYRTSKKESDMLALTDIFHQIKAKLPTAVFQDLTFFEVTTLIGFAFFAEERTEMNVLEVGLGGRLDATNIADPRFSIIVSLDYDHQEYLGNDILDVAREKFGITRPGKPVFWGNRGAGANDERVTRFVEMSCAERKIPLYTGDRDFGLDSNNRAFVRRPDGSILTFKLPKWVQESPIFLRENFVLSFAVFYQDLQNILKDDDFTLILNKIADAGRPQTWKARFQEHSATVEGRRQPLYIDVCHNVGAALAIGQHVTNEAKHRHKPPLILSVLADKNVDEMLQILRMSFSPIIAFVCQNERSVCMNDPRFASTILFESFGQAFNHAKENWPLDTPWYILGSCYSMEEVFSHLDFGSENTTNSHEAAGRQSVHL